MLLLLRGAALTGLKCIIRMCRTEPKVQLRLAKDGNEEILQDGYRLVLLPSFLCSVGRYR